VDLLPRRDASSDRYRLRPALRGGGAVLREGAALPRLCPGSSRDPASGATAAQSRIEQSVDVGGVLLQFVPVETESRAVLGFRSQRLRSPPGAGG
jgi:hypothetical protein